VSFHENWQQQKINNKTIKKNKNKPQQLYCVAQTRTLPNYQLEIIHANTSYILFTILTVISLKRRLDFIFKR
jgi:hypothetical protein